LYEEALRLQQEGAPLHIRDLQVDGNDLMQLGFEANETLGHALSHLLSMVLHGQLENIKEDLLAEARAWLLAKKREKAQLEQDG